MLHFIAWVVTLAVGVAYVSANWHDQGPSLFWESGRAGFMFSSVHLHGWPIIYFERHVSEVTHLFNGVTTTDIQSTYSSTGLICDVATGLLIIAATGFVFWRLLWRRRNPFQVRLQSLFILTTIVALFCVGYRESSAIYTLFVWFPLYIQIPLGIGIGCTIFMSLWLAVRLVSALVKRLSKRRLATQIEEAHE